MQTSQALSYIMTKPPQVARSVKTTKPLHAFFNSFPLLEVFSPLLPFKPKKKINFLMHVEIYAILGVARACLFASIATE